MKQKSSKADQDPTTGDRSGAKVRSPAQACRTLRSPRLVTSLMFSIALAIASSSGRASQGGDSVSSAGDASTAFVSGLKYHLSAASITSGQSALPSPAVLVGLTNA